MKTTSYLKRPLILVKKECKACYSKILNFEVSELKSKELVVMETLSETDVLFLSEAFHPLFPD